MEIREVRVEDAEGFLGMLTDLDNETRYMMYEPGERGTTCEEQREMIEEGIREGNPVFIAIKDGEIAGFLEGERGGYRRIRHTLYIALGVLKRYSGLGMGRALLERCESWARENKVTRIELTVVCENTRAVELYRRIGFEIEGIKRGSLMIGGTPTDEYYMGKIIERI